MIEIIIKFWKHIFFVVVILPFYSFCQNDFQITLGYNYDEKVCRIIETSNNDYLVSSGTYSIGSGDRDIQLTRLDQNGNIIWNKIWGTPGRDVTKNIYEIANNQFLILNWIEDAGTTDDIFLMVVDGEGNTIHKKYIGDGYDDEIFAMAGFSNNYYTLGSSWSYTSSGACDIMLVSFNDELDTQWVKNFGTDAEEHPRNIYLSNDNNLYLIGFQRTSGTSSEDIFISKSNLEGNLMWNKKIFGSNAERGKDIVEADDNNLIAVGFTESFGAGNYDVFAFKFTPDGEILWAKTYGGSSEDKVYNISSSGNGTYFMTGHTASFGAGSFDLLFIEIDGDGNVQNAKTYGGDEEDREGYHIPTSDQGLIISGFTKSFGEGLFDTFIVKADNNGSSCCSEDIQNLQVNSVFPQITDFGFTTSSDIGYKSYSVAEEVTELFQTYICPDSVTLIGPDTVCPNAQHVAYFLEPAIPLTYEWILPPETIIDEIVGDTLVYLNFGNTSGFVKIQATHCNNIIIDSIYVFVFQENTSLFGNDTTICNNTPFLLDPEGSFESYLWQNASTDTALIVETTGTYWVEVTNEMGCSATDSIYILVIPAPTVDLGPDTAMCPDESILLELPNIYTSYLWSDGTTGTAIDVTEPGIYWVEVCSETGCCNTDTIKVSLYPIAAISLDLGNDTSFCSNSSLTLNAGSGYTYYEWMNQPGTNDSIFTVDTAGTYFVYVSNPCSEGWDTIHIETIEVEQFDLGSDSTLCEGDLILLNAGFGFISYFWQDGSTNASFYADNSGWYWVEATDENACIVTDSIHLDFISPNPAIGPDTSFCEGDSVTFIANSGFMSYLWNNGSGQAWFVCNQSMTVWCQVTDTMGCLGADSAFAEMIYAPVVNLGSDLGICPGDTAIIKANLPDSVVLFSWQDGSQDSVFITTNPGVYWLQADNQCGSTTDTIVVEHLSLPVVSLGNDTILSSNTSTILDAGSGFVSYYWSNGSEEQWINVEESGSYWVEVSDGNCVNADTIVIEPVSCELFVPIVFTPNRDQLNDNFFANVSEDIYDFNLIVFNRWGEKMWETTDKMAQWDGTRNGHPADTGVYYWIVTYKCKGTPQKFERKGSVTLLR